MTPVASRFSRGRALSLGVDFWVLPPHRIMHSGCIGASSGFEFVFLFFSAKAAKPSADSREMVPPSSKRCLENHREKTVSTIREASRQWFRGASSNSATWFMVAKRCPSPGWVSTVLDRKDARRSASDRREYCSDLAKIDYNEICSMQISFAPRTAFVPAQPVGACRPAGRASQASR